MNAQQTLATTILNAVPILPSLNFAETRQLPFKVALDVTGEAAKAYGDVALTPTTFVLDKQGKILKRYVGKPEFAELHKLIEKLLAEK